MMILVINPGSTSTKMAVSAGETQLLRKNIAHSAEELAEFDEVIDQIPFRTQLVLDALEECNIPLKFDAVIGRGGLAKPVQGGVYEVNQKMVDDARNCIHMHACDLGCIISDIIAKKIPGCRSFIADPGVVDELNDYARISGSPLMNRICIWHALNQKAIARRFAAEEGREYEELNLIICHLGGGISVAAHDHGRAVDANNALDGEGPFSPERAGSLPASDLIRLCFSGKYTEAELLKRIAGQAGLNAHLGTNDAREVERRITEDHDPHAQLIFNAMIYHVAKAIAAEGAVLYGKIDAILITGGMARSEYIIKRLKNRVGWMAPVHVYPGEDELEALALNAVAVLRGQREARLYD